MNNNFQDFFHPDKIQSELEQHVSERLLQIDEEFRHSLATCSIRKREFVLVDVGNNGSIDQQRAFKHTRSLWIECCLVALKARYRTLPIKIWAGYNGERIYATIKNPWAKQLKQAEKCALENIAKETPESIKARTELSEFVAGISHQNQKV